MNERLRSRWARGINLFLGVWIFWSAFVLRHTAESSISTWAAGVVIASFATFAMFDARGRFGSLVASAWLLASAFVIPYATSFARWHNAILGVIVFAVALVPGPHAQRARQLQPPREAYQAP